MPNSIQYKDYFSLKTLMKFNVNPETNLNINDSKQDILKVFGNLSNEDKTFLSSKVDAMYLDNGIKIEKDRIKISVDELDEDFMLDASIKVDDKEMSLEKEDLRI